MSEVKSKLKVMPVDADVESEDLIEEIQEELSDDIDVAKTEVEPVAFGLESILLWTLTQDEDGGTDDIEETIEGITDVESVQTEEVTRV
jgi:translation elongation factor aEF-1 beta